MDGQRVAEEEKEKQQQANSFLGIVHELKNKKDKLEDREETVANLRARIDIRPESDEWLQQTLAEYEEKMSRWTGDNPKTWDFWNRVRDMPHVPCPEMARYVSGWS